MTYAMLPRITERGGEYFLFHKWLHLRAIHPHAALRG